MSKQDGYSSRTAVDLERKYNFGKTFAEVYGLVSDAQRTANEAQAAFDNLSHEQIFNLLTNYGEFQGIYRGDDGGVYINATYIQSGEIAAERIDLNKLIVTKAEKDDEEDLTFGDLFGDVGLESNMTTIVGGIITTDYVEALKIKVQAAQIEGTLSVNQINMKGNITWEDLSDDVQGTIEDAADSGGYTKSQIKTIINDQLVASPTIAGGVFCDLDQEYFLEMNADADASEYGLLLCEAGQYGAVRLFGVLYDGYGRIEMHGPSGAFLGINNNGTVNAAGDWSFEYADSIDFNGRTPADLGIDLSDIEERLAALEG